MAVLAGVGGHLSAKRPERGRVVLLFQPAEETGQGAKAIVEDPRFEEIRPDFAFALHNLPGYPLGKIVLRSGAICSASRGMAVRLSGKTAHASQPETGRSPAAALCRIIMRLSDLCAETDPPGRTAFATVVGARLGEKAFGTAPGHADIWATLRSESDEAMSDLVRRAEAIARECAIEEDLPCHITYEDVFNATVNDESAVDLIRNAVGRNSVQMLDRPLRLSEDFGRFTALSRGAFFCIGAGIDSPPLHHVNYDYPDALIPLALATLRKILQCCLA
jgi:amidohydrolase